jgi:hypothetical protein
MVSSVLCSFMDGDLDIVDRCKESKLLETGPIILRSDMLL